MPACAPRPGGNGHEVVPRVTEPLLERLSRRLTFVIAPVALLAWMVLLWLMFGDVL